MLSLTRRKNQSLIITLPNNEKITIHIAKLSPSQCQVVLDLPSKNYIVDRAEIHEYFEKRRKEAKSNVEIISEA
jgi:sRNA-binding carbon storage regulator CsrA